MVALFQAAIELVKVFFTPPLVWNWIWIIPFGIVVRLLKSGKFKRLIKGKIGEKKVSDSLSSLPKDKYKTLNDILLSNENGTSQIDHIIVSVYGVFAIETKNYQGQIYGTEDSEDWTQNIYGNKSYFKNPIRQNYGHIKTIKEHLAKFGDLPVYSVITFSNEADISRVNTTTPVINRKELSSCISSLYQTEILTDDLVEEIVKTINADNITDKEARKKHNEAAQFSKYKKEEAIKEGTCPRCGGNLVIRYGKNGKFRGCSNYPKCKYTDNYIDKE